MTDEQRPRRQQQQREEEEEEEKEEAVFVFLSELVEWRRWDVFGGTAGCSG